ncbi:hypothetical protein TSMEX_010345 [Taenia solium]|eukprot:TsM_001155700 transcript=TsM_001155700 gene=TsM_001155700
MSPSSAYASATLYALLFGPPTTTLTAAVQNQPASLHPPPPLLTMWVVRTCVSGLFDSREIEVQRLLKRITVEDVCAYWPANAPGSECSLKKRRFYQKGRICLCQMPPGIYHQRLKINFSDVFEGAQISQFLINILFSGQALTRDHPDISWWFYCSISAPKFVRDSAVSVRNQHHRSLLSIKDTGLIFIALVGKATARQSARSLHEATKNGRGMVAFSQNRGAASRHEIVMIVALTHIATRSLCGRICFSPLYPLVLELSQAASIDTVHRPKPNYLRYV